VQSMSWSKGLSVTAAGTGVVSHAGSALPRLLADRVGLTGALSAALARRDFVPVHDRGRVLTDLGVLLADGGQRISDIVVLRDQGELFGSVASAPTLWRALNELDTAALHRVEAARATVRARVWDLITARHGGLPASRTCYGDLGSTVVIRLDATLVNVFSDKENARPTFKKGFGFHPLTAWCDNTGEALAVQLRPGNAGSNTTTDHVNLIDRAIAAVPAAHRRDLLVTIDGAGASHAVVEHLNALNTHPTHGLRGRKVHYSIGVDLNARARTAITVLPAGAWEPALDASGQAREDAAVADLTGLLRQSHTGDQLATWPADLRVIVRREPIAVGKQVSLFEQLDGHRYQVIATNTPTGQIQRLEARHRVQARVEAGIRTGKDTGLARLPSRDYAINTAWCHAVVIGIDLLAWTRLLALDGDLAKAEPGTLRYRLLHVGARIVRGQRRRHLKIPTTWPWTDQLVTAFTRIMAIPAPT